MAKSYTFATSFLTATVTAAGVADAVDYAAANAGEITQPRVLWKGALTTDYIQLDYGAGVTKSPPAFWINNTNVQQWSVVHSDTDGSGGDNLGTLQTNLDPRCGRAKAIMLPTITTARRYTRFIPSTYHPGLGTIPYVGALAAAAAKTDLDDYIGEELVWRPLQDILVRRFPGGGVQHSILGPQFVGTSIRNAMWLQSGSSVKSQLTALIRARPGPILIYEAWRNDPMYAYLMHITNIDEVQEKYVTFNANIDFEEYV